jgi:hypothetical protein
MQFYSLPVHDSLTSLSVLRNTRGLVPLSQVHNPWCGWERQRYLERVWACLAGYSLRDGLYEVFKVSYQNLAEEDLSNTYKPAIWLKLGVQFLLHPHRTSPNGTAAFGATRKQLRLTSSQAYHAYQLSLIDHLHHGQISKSTSSKRSCSFSTLTFSPNPRIPTPKPLSSV